ncbi:MAG: NAD(P)-dependent oxidoreductase [Clostridiales bacterium]|nr:NAD(P)-dependent oxidoreductase [Clostridiales bacterium]
MGETVQEDLEYIANTEFIPWDKLNGKTIFVTGATGLIGYNIVCSLLYAGEKRKLDIQIVALVRDEKRARERFAQQEKYFEKKLKFVVGSVEYLPHINGTVHYIIHGASQTGSRAFVEQPVETMKTLICGTMNLLEMAKDKDAEGFAYLSSMEVYGYPQKGHKVVETDIGTFSPLELRNSYPLSKVQCESLCHAYAEEYGIPTKIIRLTQTFGSGVNYNDGRVFAYIGRCVKEKTDIVLKTKGETERSYLYVRDAVTAILTILLKGEIGGVYNAADESTYCSIAEMAKQIANSAGIQVKFDIQPESQNGYPNTLYMDLDAGRLKALGWRAGTPLLGWLRE